MWKTPGSTPSTKNNQNKTVSAFATLDRVEPCRDRTCSETAGGPGTRG